MKNTKNTSKKIIAVAVLILLGMAAANFIPRKLPMNSEKTEHFSKPIQKTAFALDTFVTITLYDSDDEAILEQALALCEQYEKIFSATLEDSELYQINHRTSNRVNISESLAHVIERGLYYGQISGGAIDISIEPVRELWDFKSSEPKLPDEEKLQKALHFVNYRNIELEGNTLIFKNSETMIDLGAIAKGYIADRMKDFLVEKGIQSAIINLGGNVLCIGKKTDGSDFKIGLQMPFADRDEVIERISVNGLSVVTSGVYERHFEIDGKEFHHILNPKTGYPYDTGIIGVSIVCASSEEADALSTTCFSLGAKKGMELIDSIPGTYAYFILEDESILYSKGAQELVVK